MTTPARVLTLLLALILVVGCNPGPEGPGAGGQRDIEAIQQSGKLIVALEPVYTPFEMKTSKGELIGFDVELIREVAKRMNVKVEFKEVEWDGIIPALQTGTVDCICSGMSITEERKKVISFSDPYYQVGQAVLINVKDKNKYKKYTDLNAEGVVITVQQGTTGEKAARETYKNATIKPFPKSFEAAQEVRDGRAGGFVFDHPYIAIYAMRNKAQVTGLMEQFTTEPIGIAVNKDRTHLLGAINQSLNEMKQDGTIERLEKKYFVDMPWLPDVKD